MKALARIALTTSTSAVAAVLILVLSVAPAFAGALFAVVNADGTLDRGKGVDSSFRDSRGDYVVIFKKNIRKCGYVATIGLEHGRGPGEIAVAGAAIDVKGVFVSTFDSAGAEADRGFHLNVIC